MTTRSYHKVCSSTETRTLYIYLKTLSHCRYSCCEWPGLYSVYRMSVVKCTYVMYIYCPKIIWISAYTNQGAHHDWKQMQRCTVCLAYLPDILYVYNSQTYTVVSAPALTKLGFYAEIQIVLGQFTLYVNRIKGYNFNCYFSETD